MEGERNSIQHQEINKSIPFLELIHSLEFSRRIVGKRWSSNPIDLHYTRKETFRFSGGNVTSEKRRQTSFFLVPFHPFTYFLIRSSSNKSTDLFSIFLDDPADIFRSLPIIKFPTKLEIGISFQSVAVRSTREGWTMGARDENNGSGEITGITFDGKVKYFKHRGRVFFN